MGANDYAWEGMPLCIHGYQFDCDQCRRKDWLLDTVKEAASEVYFELESGHTEIVYEAALEVELGIKNISPIRRQVPCPIYYKETVVGNGIIDMLIGYDLIVEIKAVAKLAAKDKTQVMKYLQNTGLKRGLLINFGPELEIWDVVNDTTGELSPT